MSMIKTTTLLALLLSASCVTAHGVVQGIVADGTYYTGYSPGFQFSKPPPVVAGWSVPEDLSTGFVSPSNYSNPSIICHLDATPGGTFATVAAGGTVELQWTKWPVSHHGPVLDYLANCNGPCTSVDKTKLDFVKIDAVGLISGAVEPGTWASDQLIANNNSWVVTIPTSIAPGNYVLRHEIIALHSAGTVNGSQNYPQCVNLKVTGSGTDSLPSGIPATEFYKETDPGIEINIYTPLSTYIIPGPTLYSGAVSISQSIVPITASVAAESSLASTTAIATSASAYTSVPVDSSYTVASASSSYPVVSAASTSSYPAPFANATAHSKPSDDCSDVETASSTLTVSVIPISSLASTTAMPITSTTTYSPTSSTSPILSSTPTSTSPIPPTTPASTSEPPNSTLPPNPLTSLPQGLTLTQLLEWLEVVIDELLKDTSKQRRHVRDLGADA
ncbi:hypothetical protein MMC12_002457 [Toensbergia leucococca]|nr:hypothetical protein [Toensbergia leucococca]